MVEKKEEAHRKLGPAKKLASSYPARKKSALCMN